MKKTLRCPDMVGAFKKLARFSCCISLIFVLYYIICVPLHNKRAQTAQVARHSLGKRWDLGSIPRSPHLIHKFCFNVFQCSARPKVHHTRSRSGLTRTPDVPSNGQIMQSMVRSFNHPTHDPKKSSEALFWWAKIASKKPPKWARHPQCLYYIF